MKKVMIYPGYISGNEASQIAEQENLKEEWMGAKYWFEGVIEVREEFELENMPKYNRFICHMDYVESDLYYDYGADYYFAVLNKLKTENMKRNAIRLTESDLHNIIKETVNKILKENDDFQPHGYKTTSNWGGNEIQISNSGDGARIRDSHTGKISDWMEIQFDEEGVAYIVDENGNEERLCDYMRY